MDGICIIGPVRGIDFHSNQPLFVSGGDDYKIKVGQESTSKVHICTSVQIQSTGLYLCRFSRHGGDAGMLLPHMGISVPNCPTSTNLGRVDEVGFPIRHVSLLCLSSLRHKWQPSPLGLVLLMHSVVQPTP